MAFFAKQSAQPKYTITDEELKALLTPANSGVTQPDVRKLPKLTTDAPDRKEEAHLSKKQKALLKTIGAR